jgi:hexosaminidase
MKFKLINDSPEIISGVLLLKAELNFEISDKGMALKIEKSDQDQIVVSKKGDYCFIQYNKKIHLFRALGLLMEALQDQLEFYITETPAFTMNGIMFDVSQGNAVILPEVVKKILLKMAVMGLDMLMLYMEDSFDISDEPYFGYMRGRYTQDELKDLDDFADALGIEIIPAIQTLAHLIDVLKWERFDRIKDGDATLFIGEPETYTFIENMIRTVSKPFRSKRIHIGMDEAWNLGRGKYQDLYGVKSTFEIMNEHLNLVTGIVEKYGLEPMIWSDMYFRTSRLTGYGNNYDEDAVIPETVVEKIPAGMQLVFWQYNYDNEEFYHKIINKHKEIGRKIIFAGGIWNWMGFGVNYGLTFRTTNAALKACKEQGIKEVYATIWGDDGTENNIFSTLLGMQLYAEHGYSRELDQDKLKKRFNFCTGGNYDDFMNIKYIDEIPCVNNDNFEMQNPSKYLLWQNILGGLFDRDIEGMELSTYYGKLREKMKIASERNGNYGYIFKQLYKLCSVLEIKAELGLMITKAYSEKNMEKLRQIAGTILPELSEKVTEMKNDHRILWFNTNKAFGWEIIDIRYASLLSSIDTAIMRIDAFYNGHIEKIEELEEKRLYFKGYSELPAIYYYNRIYSASRLSQ